MLIDTRNRSTEAEIMDDFNMEGQMLKETLQKIAKINRTLGGNRATISGVLQLIRNKTSDQPIIIADIGCGNGEMLRKLAEIGRRKNLNFSLIGIDANATTIDFAKELSANYPEIQYYCQDVLDPAFRNERFDIILGTLTLHHFKESEIFELMTLFCQQARVGVVINDLHRSAVAYHLFGLLCILFNWNPMVRTDGKISILRGFKKAELEKLSESLQINRYSITWKWAFRYQWIIKNL
ncbi:methyltransferase domain-containing protein [Chitinophaga silvatica]|uniref:Methyltransferase domain-containing protein n=1 Tax=Chitinophaga silvatica TaxID=2282649 RepID=A0A3E1YGP1_9BACT|nr:methyltransferase domain-containing protein [Chitinophaga silvatica]RFS26537.1 methyltransferase domain-containing protein [Chitinophaga silvatica]